jgi:hypothetical protein
MRPNLPDKSSLMSAYRHRPREFRLSPSEALVEALARRNETSCELKPMRKWLASLLLAVALVTPAAAGPYAPYEFLIGDWDVSLAEGPPAMVARFSWGPNRSYIRYAASLLTAKGEEPHFEGVLMWNGVAKNLDMLLMLDLTERAAVQERGTLSVAADGTLVREINASYSEGATPLGGQKAGPAGTTVHFRQTYRRLAPDKIATAAMRETPQGWVPTFPGGDRMIMTRRSTTDPDQRD